MLNLQSPGDLTGSLVSATKNVAVFSGNVCTASGLLCCCDHLEQQMVPVDTWGKDIVLASARIRLKEQNRFRVVAHIDGTVVTFGTGGGFELGAGEFKEFNVSGTVRLSSSKPVLAAQILASSYEVSGLAPCKSDADCDSSVCYRSEEDIADDVHGQCAPACIGSVGSSCLSSEACYGAGVLDDLASGGACIFRQCKVGAGHCPGGTCIPNSDGITGLCVAKCATSSACGATTVCEDKKCLYDPCDGGESCGSGSCLSDLCFSQCTPAACPLKHTACHPGWLGDDGKLRGPRCISTACTSSADCDSGYACSPAYEDGNRYCEPIGDPALILAVPTEQFRDEYVFLVPDAYIQDELIIIAPSGATVSLDGTPIPASSFSDAAGLRVARVGVADGPHTLTATAPVGLTVYGYDDDVSYGYPAGISLFDLTE